MSMRIKKKIKNDETFSACKHNRKAKMWSIENLYVNEFAIFGKKRVFFFCYWCVLPGRSTRSNYSLSVVFAIVGKVFLFFFTLSFFCVFCTKENDKHWTRLTLHWLLIKYKQKQSKQKQSNEKYTIDRKRIEIKWTKKHKAKQNKKCALTN